jgi:hypothetical protein
MPRKTTKAPTKFLSDDEASDDEPTGSIKKDSPVSVCTPPVVIPQPGHLKRVFTLPDDDNMNVNTAFTADAEVTSSPKIKGKEGPLASLVDVITILTDSKANLKGRIDDSGRFELEFDLQQTSHGGEYSRRRRTSYDRTPSPVSTLSYASASPPEKERNRGKPGSRRIGWVR